MKNCEDCQEDEEYCKTVCLVRKRLEPIQRGLHDLLTDTKALLEETKAFVSRGKK
jgi:hypothetical protein